MRGGMRIFLRRISRSATSAISTFDEYGGMRVFIEKEMQSATKDMERG
jgi:hypothetical protein